MSAHAQTPVGDAPERLRQAQERVAALEDQLRRERRRRREAEDRLEGLRTIFDALPLRIFWKDRNCSYRGCNAAFAADAGLSSAAQVVGMTDYDLAWSRQEADLYRECDQRAMWTDSPCLNLQESQLQASGRSVLIETSRVPLHDGYGKVTGLVGLYRVCSEAASDAASLSGPQEGFRDLVENLNEILFTLDTQGSIRYISPAIEAITGYHPSEVIGQLFHRFVHKDDLALAQRHVDSTMRAPTPAIEVRILTRSGQSRWMRSSSRVIQRDGRVQGIVGVISDMTEQRALEQQLRQAQKMEAIGQLAGGVAHDFNNLLTTILGYCDLLLMEPAKESVRIRGLGQIRKAAQSAAMLTQQLLAFSRKRLSAPQSVDLCTVLGDMREMLKCLTGENIDLRVRASGQAGTVRCDPAQIEQVIINLAVNARDAMSSGGRLSIETEVVEFERAQFIGDAQLPPGAYVRLSVTDNGMGMDEATLARIYEPFFTTKEKGKGTGLGLAMVYGIVEQSGGRIEVESRPGWGTRFSIYLPRETSAQQGQDAFAEEAPRQNSYGNERVLVVEDDQAVRSLLSEVLNQNGYRVLEASHPENALRTAERVSEPIDLLVADVVMPTMSGPQLAARLTAMHPETRVLYISGYAADALGRHGVPEAAFLQKPYLPDAFVAKVRQLLDESC